MTLDATFMDIPNEPDPQQPAELQRWRKLERERLINERLR